MSPWKETQKFADKSTRWVLAIAIIVPLLIGIYYKSEASLLIVVGSMAFVVLLIASLKLDTRIDESGIHFKYFPFHTTERLIPWQEVKAWKIVDVNALKDFGGIGIRYARKKKGFILNSKSGLEIEKTDGRIIVISVTDKAQVEAALQYFQPVS